MLRIHSYKEGILFDLNFFGELVSNQRFSVFLCSAKALL